MSVNNLSAAAQSLQDVLDRSMFAAAAGGSLSPRVIDSSTTRSFSGLWMWTHEHSRPSGFGPIACSVKHNGHAEHGEGIRVLESVRWSELTVRIGGVEHRLPLDSKDHVLKRFALTDQSIPEGHHPVWPLAARIHSGILVVCGFLITKTGKIAPFDDAALRLLDSPLLLKERAGKHEQPCAPHNHERDCVLSSTRVVVCMELLLAKSSDDWVPGELVSVGRINPHLLVAANVPIERMEARLCLARSDSKSAQHRPLLIADTNRAIWLKKFGGLHWDNIFDYYATDTSMDGKSAPKVPRDREIVAVAPSGLLKRDIEKWVFSHMESSIGYGLNARPVYRRQEGAFRVERQGEFDNVHIAPLMSYRVGGVIQFQASTADVVMAPFCVHDCFHLHWRWGQNLPDSGKYNKGWSSDAPYSVAGAPMVPINQNVWIKVPRDGEIEYIARISGSVTTGTGSIPAGQVQVVFHHGAAYSFDYSTAYQALVGLQKTLTDGPWDSLYDWAAFYWSLRYNLDRNHGVYERHQMPDNFQRNTLPAARSG